MTNSSRFIGAIVLGLGTVCLCTCTPTSNTVVSTPSGYSEADIAVGLDRMVALTLGMDNIRDVIAFPKTASATDLMCDAPSVVESYQLEDVHIDVSARAKAALDEAASEADS